MPEEPVDADQESVSSPAADAPDEDVTLAVLGGVLRLMDLEDEAEGRLPLRAHLNARYWQLSTADLLAGYVAVEFAKGYIDALAGRAADASLGLVQHVRFRRNRRTGEMRAGVDGGGASTVVITDDLPDEARLALLDLDITADGMRGKELGWDPDAGAWLPTGADDARPGEARTEA